MCFVGCVVRGTRHRPSQQVVRGCFQLSGTVLTTQVYVMMELSCCSKINIFEACVPSSMEMIQLTYLPLTATVMSDSED